jgi:hypothetical protein
MCLLNVKTTIKIEWRKIIRRTNYAPSVKINKIIFAILPRNLVAHLVIQFVESLFELRIRSEFSLHLIHLMPTDPFDVLRLIKFTLCVHCDIIIALTQKKN